MVFPQEEVHVVELHRVGSVFIDKMPENGDGTLRRLHLFITPISRMHPTEAAIERTANAGVVNRSPLSKERWPQVFIHWDAMKGRPGKAVWPFNRPLAIAAV